MSNQDEVLPSAKALRKAGHQEVIGETLAAIGFFNRGWNPYSRLLDVDKVDLVLRRKGEGGEAVYRELQVKYGRLYDYGPKWQQNLFDVTSWRLFGDGEFDRFRVSKLRFYAYVLALPGGYQGDIFIFTAREFADLVNSAILTKTKKGKLKRKVSLSRTRNEKRWFLRTSRGQFDALDEGHVVEVTAHRRAFRKLEG